MENEIDRRELWALAKSSARRFCDDGKFPHRRVERAIAAFERLYGQELIEKDIVNGHPLTQLMFAWPNICQFIEYFELLEFAASNGSSEDQIADMVTRTKTSSWLHFTGVFEELRVLYCLNRVGLPALKLAENKAISTKNRYAKTQDLTVSRGKDSFNVEVTQLLGTEEMARAQWAWQRLRDMYSALWSEKGRIRIENKPFSRRHVAHMEKLMRASMDEAMATGIARYVEPGIISCVLWKDSHDQEAQGILAELDLKNDGLVMDWAI